MKLILTERFTDERGQASLYLLIGLAISLTALSVLFIRLGQANDMRTTTQSAADAAALAAAGDIQDRVARTIADGNLPWGVTWKADTGKAKAEKYASENDATVTDIRASDNDQGRLGNFVRVEVRGDTCQRELQDDESVSWNFRQCPDKEEIERADKRGETIPVTTGNAAAIARVQVPECKQVPVFDIFGVQIFSYIACRPSESGGGYQRIWTYGQAKEMTDVELVDREGQWIYSELTGGPGSGRYPCDAVGGQNITRQMCATHEAIMDEWGSVFERYGVGCYRSQEDGGEHPRGRACDYMVSANGNLPSTELKRGSDAAAQWMIDNHEELDIYYIMWDHHIWNPNRDSVGQWDDVKRWVPNRGGNTVNHLDHIHVSVNS
ncbi:pilus assembly protein TadG-related protein [Nocardiopsis halophila]|uniref:pilus assembly protein TadG-related protein n=1 Tax=Nocardiopsis halophila TaxID=141692 RepID=UPI000364CC01|nr:pilus assembly protein TadG-related protein [Nocardiopsis halophila]